MAAGEAVSVRELPAPRFPALATLGFAPASYPSRPRDAPVRPGSCCGPEALPAVWACMSVTLQVRQDFDCRSNPAFASTSAQPLCSRCPAHSSCSACMCFTHISFPISLLLIMSGAA